MSALSLLDRAVGGRVRKALKSKSCRRAAIIFAGSATGAFCALEAYEGYGVRSPAMTHVLVCFGIEGMSQAVTASSSRDFKKTFNNLAGRSKTLVFLALNVLRVKGQSPVERGGLRCFTAFLSFSAIQEFEEIAGVQVVVPWLCRLGPIVADHALAVLRHVVRPVVLAGADALVFVIKRVVNVARLVGRVMRWSYGVVAKAADACSALLVPAGRAVKRLWSRCGAF